MNPPLPPSHVVAVGLSPADMARASSLLGTQATAAGAARLPELLARPDLELLMVDLAAAGPLVPAPEELPSSGPPLLVLHDPAQAGQVQALARVRPIHLVCRDAGYAERLPLAAHAALCAGRLSRGRVAALEEEKHRLESAIECMSEGLLILDREYRFATINTAARKLLGVENLEELAARLSRREIDEGLHPVFWLDAHGEQAKPIRCWAARQCGRENCPAHGSGLFPCWLYDGTLCEEGAVGAFPGKLQACSRCTVYQRNARLDDPAQAHGHREVSVERPARRIFLTLSAPVFDEDGRFLGAVKLLHDVTTERMLEQIRADFTSFITHELRTPLTSVSGFLGLVLGGHAGEINETQRRQLEAAQRQADRLKRLVDDLLHVAAIESGRLELQVGHFDLVPLLVECVEALRPQAGAKGIALHVRPTAEPFPVRADRERITQVLTNLISNAIAYTDAGGRVEIGLREADEGVVVEVADTGRGIAPGDIPRIFDKFHRVRSPAAARTPGTGLGLAICKGVVEAHRGRIWVESQPGQGSRFLFTIPPPPEAAEGRA